MNYKNKNKGFSLVELMIVVAIIGILASIAIPQYNNYIARSQVTEAMTLGAAARTSIEEWVSSNGGAAVPLNLLVTAGARINGTYVECIIIDKLNTNPAACADPTDATVNILTPDGVGLYIHIRFRNNTNANLAGNSITMARSAPSGVWACGNIGITFTPAAAAGQQETVGAAAADGANDVERQFRPAACQQ
ncbi:MAG: pilin [Methylacidiphilales bacterium]|nr:pilin [Candidatus Methylacidiphilales bacterium]